MTYLTETNAWGPGVYQLEKTDPVTGGPGGVDNWQAQELANRTAYLKTELEKRAPLESPALTGIPTAPTAAVDTSTTQIATTAFVAGQAGTGAPLANGAAAPGTSKRYARQDHVHPTDTTRAPLASPALTGTPTAPTAGAGTITTQIATTEFVQREIGGVLIKDISGGATTFNLTTAETSNSVIRFDGVLTNNVTVIFPTGVKRLWVLDNRTSGNYTLTCKTAAGGGATISQGHKKIVAIGDSFLYQASDDFDDINLTGAPTAPTPAPGTNNTQLATTAFVSALAGGTVTAASSLAATGYQKLPSGLIIQWGSSVTSGATVSVTFPIAFSSACYVAIPVNFGSFLYVCPTAVSKTAATFSANGSNQSFYWIAIGK